MNASCVDIHVVFCSNVKGNETIRRAIDLESTISYLLYIITIVTSLYIPIHSMEINYVSHSHSTGACKLIISPIIC